MHREMPKNETRRRIQRVSKRCLLKRVGSVALLSGVSPLLWAAFVEPFRPIVERVSVRLRDLPPAFDGLRVALLSDIHLQTGFDTDQLAPALAHLEREQPDLVLLLGDYVDGRLANKVSYIARCAEAFASVRAPLGTFAIFGNHDYPEPPADPDSGPWRAAHIRPLHGEAVELWRGSDRLFLVGLRSLLSRPAYPKEIMHPLPPDACRIVLWHEGDWAPQTAALGASLQVSGHTHGGQVRMPFFGPPFLPRAGRLFISGLYRVGEMPLYVTRGVGLLAPRVRFNCPPEVTILTLRTS